VVHDHKRPDEQLVAARHPRVDRPAGTSDPTGLLRLGRLAGNQAVQSAIARGLVVQRHPEGAGMSVDPEAALAEQAAADAADEAAGETSTEAGTTAPAPTETPAAEGGDKKPPAPAKPAYLDLAKAKEVLTKAYGTSKTIETGKIEFVDTREAAWAKYDELCIAGNVHNTRTGAKWKAGDAKATYPLGLNGWNWKGTSYVNKASAGSTTTPHEMLHGNTADGFRAAVGETFNEGITQYLTLKALKASKIAPPASIPYAAEVKCAEALIAITGEQAVIDAYFKGGASTTAMIKKVDDELGAGTFAKAKTAGADYAKVKAALKKKPKPKPPPKPALGDYPLPDSEVAFA
jgi:hypothetical protein